MTIPSAAYEKNGRHWEQEKRGDSLAFGQLLVTRMAGLFLNTDPGSSLLKGEAE